MKTSRILIALATFCTTVSGRAADLNRYAFTLQIKDAKGSNSFGTGSIVKYKTSAYYITAHHIFGKITDGEIKSALKNITFVNEFDPTVRIRPEAFLPIANVRDLSKTDLLIFRLRSESNLAKHALPLASIAPQKDESVFLAARIPNQPLSTYSLKILEADDERVHYEKIPGVTKYTGASGGPIINAKGEIVGTYLGRMINADESIACLFGTPLKSLIATLEQASRLPGN